MKKYLTVFFALNIFAFCLAVSGYASALDDMKKAQASSKAAEQASENVNSNNIAASQYALEQTRKQGSQNFDTKNIATSSATSTPKTTTSNTADKTVTGTITPHNSSPKLKLKSKPVPPVPATVNTQTTQTQTQKQTTQTTQTTKQTTQSTQQNTAVKQSTQTQSSATVTNTAAQTAPAAVTNTAVQTKSVTAAPATQNNTLKAPPKAKLSVQQRGDTTALVQSNQFKKDMTKPKAVKPEKYGKKKKVYLKDFEPERHGASLVTPDQIPEGTNVTAEDAEAMYKWLSAEEKNLYDEETKRNFAIARDKWYKYWQDLTKKQNERRKKLNSGKFTRPQMVLNKQWTNNPVNNSLLNRVGGATTPNSYTVNRINFRLPKPKLITPQLLNQAKKRYYEQKQRMEDYEKRAEQEIQEQAAKQAADEKRNKLSNMEWNQICDPKIKNYSNEACAMCCMHPQTKVNGFDPKIHVMTNGFLYMGRNECHCRWQGKPLTGYDTRNTSDQACTAYCLAHPNDVKGFNPAKHQMHYGELKKGQCKCHYIKKDIDICSSEVVHKTDGACARCCMERPINNRFAYGFDPAQHNMWTGYTTKVGGCSCWYDDKPGMSAPDHAAVTGLSVNVPAVSWDDNEYTRMVCDANTVNQNNGNCTKCCLAKQPQAPRIGHELDYGYLQNGQCKCHFRNPHASVCDNERKLQSDYACFECCKAQPPQGFDPSVSEMDYGRVEGDDCRCYWKAIPSNNSDSCDYPYPLADGACEQCVNNRPRSQWDCEKCCGYIQRPGLYSSQYYTVSPAPGIQPGCICHFSDGKGLGF